MLTHLKTIWKKGVHQTLCFFLTTIGKGLINLLLWTCRWEIEGLEEFQRLASTEKCILMLWHNRLAMAPFILYRYAPQFLYAAFVSNSRDGDLIGAIVRSYKIGRLIRVPHHSRHEALRELIRHVKEKQAIVIITPDGPRGPRYSMKPGLALAALETQAYVVPFNWKAKDYWELPTWDKLRIPKPFTTIHVSFIAPVHFDQSPSLSLRQANQILQDALIQE